MVSVELQGQYSYSVIPLIILGAAIILILVLLLAIWRAQAYGNKPVKKKVRVRVKNIFQIKTQYLAKLDKLSKKVFNNELSMRKAYQALSKLVRKFAYEATGIRTDSYSLQEIKEMGRTELVELVEQFYEPEFAAKSEGNIENAIEKSKEVISKWN